MKQYVFFLLKLLLQYYDIIVLAKAIAANTTIVKASMSVTLERGTLRRVLMI
jgi:hypothetical protein